MKTKTPKLTCDRCGRKPYVLIRRRTQHTIVYRCGGQFGCGYIGEAFH